jgi:LemA protein
VTEVLILVVIVGPLLFLMVWYIVIYNSFVAVRQHMRESWADVDVELQRRYSLIPNLVATVKGYAAHEKAVFDGVSKARADAMKNTGDPAHQSGDEQHLVGQLGKLFAVAEAYPDLKADQNFLDLQDELTNTEDRIAASRRFYNGNVRELNTLCESFPSSIVAKCSSFKAAGFFEVEDHSVRAAVKVDLSS